MKKLLPKLLLGAAGVAAVDREQDHVPGLAEISVPHH